MILVSCGTVKKTYMCGDEQCIDRKEFREYFANNLAVEILTKKNKKKSSIDLVKLNTSNSKSNNATIVSTKEINNLKKKEKKDILKANKRRLKEKRKAKKIEERNLLVKKKKIEKQKKNKEKEITLNKILTKNEVLDRNKSIKKPNKNLPSTDNVVKEVIVINNIKTEKQVNLCAVVNNCDIDKITELLLKKGKEKEFPNIAVR
jgi:hypothetical protein